MAKRAARRPLTTQILAGNHPVELRLEGFKPWTTDVQVKANEPLALGPIKLGLPDARLTLRSEPAGAAVSSRASIAVRRR